MTDTIAEKSLNESDGRAKPVPAFEDLSRTPRISTRRTETQQASGRRPLFRR